MWRLGLVILLMLAVPGWAADATGAAGTTGAAGAAGSEAELVKSGVVAYDAKKYDAAKALMTKVQATYPTNPWAAYYLGLISLHQGHARQAIAQWKIYQKLDPAGAKLKGTAHQIALLEQSLIQQEIKQLMAQENALSSSPPTPGTVAVFPLVNQGNSKYAVLSKGLTALMITDLSKIPGLKVLERERVQKLMDEVKLAQSGLVQDAVAQKTGRILRAERLMTGDFAIE